MCQDLDMQSGSAVTRLLLLSKTDCTIIHYSVEQSSKFHTRRRGEERDSADAVHSTGGASHRDPIR